MFKYEKSYVLKDINLEIPEHKILSVVGPNGAGKTTLLELCAGIIPYSSGKIELDNRELKSFTKKELAQSISFLPQTLNKELSISVYDLVSYGRFPYSQGALNSKDKQLVQEAIKSMNLEEYASTNVNELSGGMRQLAYIAMILAQDTKYVFLDEPTANLDIHNVRLLMKNICRLRDVYSKTVVLVLHDLNCAAFYSDYICAIKQGQLMQVKSAREFMNKENLSQIYGEEIEVADYKDTRLALYFG